MAYLQKALLKFTFKHDFEKQVEKLSRSDEQSAFLTGKILNVAKCSFLSGSFIRPSPR
jgi:hypothetical protein